MPIDIFSQFEEVSFKGISFPVSSFKTNFSQDLAIHKFPNVDGAAIENTGRNPMEFEITAHFVNGLWRGAKETWSDLYPSTYIKLINACNEPLPGTLVHPLLGLWLVQCKNGSGSIDAMKRNGEEVSLSFIETIETAQDRVDAKNLQNNAIASAVARANQLDEMTTSLNQASTNELVTELNARGIQLPKESFRSLVSAIDTVSLAQKQLVGKVNALQHSLDKMINALDRANNTSFASAKIVMENLKSDLNETKIKALSSKKIGIHMTHAPTSLARLAGELNCSLSDLGNLNPAFVLKTSIPAKSIVRYFK